MKLDARHLLWVNLTLLGTASYLAASTVSSALAARLAPPPQVQLKPPPPPLAKALRRPPTYYASIHSRDVFNPPRPVEAPAVEAEPQLTKLDLKLWGVSVHSGGNSHCIIEDLKTHKQDVYSVGSTVPGPATIKRIEWERVLLDRGGGQEEFLEIAQPGGGGSSAPGSGRGSYAALAPPPRPVAPAAAPADSEPGGTGNPRIQRLSDSEYMVERAEVDQQLDNLNQLLTQVRAVPHFEGGKSTGFRLFAIRQGSLFDQIGLRNGDIVQTINGQEMSDPARALTMFQDLRSAGEIQVAGVRNKQPFNTTYRIR